MFVRDMGDSWQIVLQPDHGELAGQLAAQWGGSEVDAPVPQGSVQVAARRHDDGWAVWEREPTILAGTSRPTGFLEVAVPSHLTFYRACIAAVGEQDPYAGMLVSMHGSGIYNGRYGTQPGLGLKQSADYPELIQAFIAEQEQAQQRVIAELGIDDAQRWVNYRLLQVYDRLAIYFSMKDLEAGEAETIAPLPLRYDGSEGELRIEPAGAPWHVRMSPFPFAAGPARFSLVRRVLPKREWATSDAFRTDFFATAPERVQITVDR
jgi:hypothetical protein